MLGLRALASRMSRPFSLLSLLEPEKPIWALGEVKCESIQMPPTELFSLEEARMSAEVEGLVCK